MYINEAHTYLKHVLQQEKNLPVFVSGPPGVGKSAVIHQLGKELHMPVRDIRVILLDPIDLRGIPTVEGGNTVWNPPGFLPKEGEPASIIFLDELNAAPPSIQAACYQLILDRRIGEYKLPDGHKIIAAGNRAKDKAVTHTMASPLVSRFLHVEIEPDIDSFTRWAVAADISEEVIGFLNFRPSCLAGEVSNNEPFPCPRTWEMASNLPAQMEYIKSAVGEKAAGEFMGYMKVYKDLPLISDVLIGPLKTRLPNSEPSSRYAMVVALMLKVTKEFKHFQSALTYIERFGSEEWVMLFMRQLEMQSQNLVGLASCQDFVNAILKYKHLIQR